MPSVKGVTFKKGEPLPQKFLDAVEEIKVPFSSAQEIEVSEKPDVEIVDFNGEALDVVSA